MNKPPQPVEYVTIPKGGRPPAIAKHIAVRLAHLHYSRKFGKAYLAEDELMKLFGVSSDGAVRKMVLKAKKALGKQGLCIQTAGGVWSWIVGGRVTRSSPHLPLLSEGAKVWVWAEGMTEAVPGIARNVNYSVSWKQPMP